MSIENPLHPISSGQIQPPAPPKAEGQMPSVTGAALAEIPQAPEMPIASEVSDIELSSLNLPEPPQPPTAEAAGKKSALKTPDSPQKTKKNVSFAQEQSLKVSKTYLKDKASFPLPSIQEEEITQEEEISSKGYAGEIARDANGKEIGIETPDLTKHQRDMQNAQRAFLAEQNKSVDDVKGGHAARRAEMMRKLARGDEHPSEAGLSDDQRIGTAGQRHKVWLTKMEASLEGLNKDLNKLMPKTKEYNRAKIAGKVILGLLITAATIALTVGTFGVAPALAAGLACTHAAIAAKIALASSGALLLIGTFALPTSKKAVSQKEKTHVVAGDVLNKISTCSRKELRKIAIALKGRLNAGIVDTAPGLGLPDKEKEIREEHNKELKKLMDTCEEVIIGTSPIKVDDITDEASLLYLMNYEEDEEISDSVTDKIDKSLESQTENDRTNLENALIGLFKQYGDVAEKLAAISPKDSQEHSAFKGINEEMGEIVTKLKHEQTANQLERRSKAKAHKKDIAKEEGEGFYRTRRIADHWDERLSRKSHVNDLANAIIELEEAEEPLDKWSKAEDLKATLKIINLDDIYELSSLVGQIEETPSKAQEAEEAEEGELLSFKEFRDSMPGKDESFALKKYREYLVANSEKVKAREDRVKVEKDLARDVSFRKNLLMEQQSSDRAVLSDHFNDPMALRARLKQALKETKAESSASAAGRARIAQIREESGKDFNIDRLDRNGFTTLFKTIDKVCVELREVPGHNWNANPEDMIKVAEKHFKPIAKLIKQGADPNLLMTNAGIKRERSTALKAIEAEIAFYEKAEKMHADDKSKRFDRAQVEALKMIKTILETGKIPTIPKHLRGKQAGAAPDASEQQAESLSTEAGLTPETNVQESPAAPKLANFAHLNRPAPTKENINTIYKGMSDGKLQEQTELAIFIETNKAGLTQNDVVKVQDLLNLGASPNITVTVDGEKTTPKEMLEKRLKEYMHPDSLPAAKEIYKRMGGDPNSIKPAPTTSAKPPTATPQTAPELPSIAKGKSQVDALAKSMEERRARIAERSKEAENLMGALAAAAEEAPAVAPEKPVPPLKTELAVDETVARLREKDARRKAEADKLKAQQDAAVKKLQEGQGPKI